MRAIPLWFSFIEQPELGRILVLLGDSNRNWRVIYTDGRPPVQPAEAVASYYGTSVGRWEGDTLVIDSVGSTKSNGLSGPIPRLDTRHSDWHSLAGAAYPAYAYNILQIAAERGLLALAAFLCFILELYRSLIGLLKTHSPVCQPRGN